MYRWSHKLEYFENIFMADQPRISPADPNTEPLRREHLNARLRVGTEKVALVAQRLHMRYI